MKNKCCFCHKDADGGFKNETFIWCHNCSKQFYKAIKFLDRQEKFFSLEEIRNYLEGFYLTNGDGECLDKENHALGLAISQLEDEEDGIEAVLKRNEIYRILELE